MTLPPVDSAVTAPYWTNRPARPDETAEILDLVHRVHGDDHPEINDAYIRWRYLNDTPFRADILLSEHQSRPIGIQPVALFDWQWGRRQLRGAMYTGVLTHPDHRRRGVFRSLIDSSNAHAASRGAQFCMTLPNDASLAGFLRFGDWQYPGLIPLFLKVINGRRLLQTKLGAALGGMFGWAPGVFFRRRRDAGDDSRISIDCTERVPEELDALTDEFARAMDRLMIRRTAAYWNWRYASRPQSAYSTFIARRDGRVVGAVVTSEGRRAGIPVGLIVDLVCDANFSTLRRLICAAEDDLRQRGLGLSTCQATSPTLQDALRAEGYRAASPALIRKRFHFVYRLTAEAGLPREPGGIEDWHLTFGDSDNA